MKDWEQEYTTTGQQVFKHYNKRKLITYLVCKQLTTAGSAALIQESVWELSKLSYCQVAYFRVSIKDKLNRFAHIHACLWWNVYPVTLVQNSKLDWIFFFLRYIQVFSMPLKKLCFLIALQFKHRNVRKPFYYSCFPLTCSFKKVLFNKAKKKKPNP